MKKIFMKKQVVIGALIACAAVVVIGVLIFVGGKQTGSEEEETLTGAAADVEQTISELMIYNADDIRESITLPDKNETYGTSISWSVDKEGIIDLTADGAVPAGVIHRQDTDTEITLTATVSKEDVSRQKTFRLTVKATPGEKITTDYLFATFQHDAGPAGQQIWFSSSRDGNNWKDLNDGKSVLSVADATEGDKGVRDPFLLRSPEGDKFYLIATDLCIGSGSGTHDWGGAQSKTLSSKYIRIWESTDLVNWSEPWLAKIGVENSNFTWAPEAIWDEESKQYMVYWTAGGTKNPEFTGSAERNRTWYSMTRDFHTFTEPQLYASSINGSDMLDMSIISAGNQTYYRISSSTPDIVLEVSRNGLFGDWEKVASLQELGFNYGAAGNTTDGIIIVEGPEIFRYNEDDSVKDADGNPLDTWGILIDNYGGIGYLPLVTTDLSSSAKVGTEDCVWFEPEYDFASPKRHGTILPITSEEYEAVMKKWGNASEISNNEPESDEPVLFYDFESVDGDVVKDGGSGNESSDDGKLFGNAKIETAESAGLTSSEPGNHVLVLDGTAGSYLEFPQGFFDGRNTMTISMDVMSELADGNFFTFTYGRSSDVYDFLRIRGNHIYNAITTGSYGAETSVAYSQGADTGVWQNITLVIDERTQYLYVDGILQASGKVARVTSDLGENLLAYLGKSFYSADGYFKGAFDNIRIYNKALTKAEIRSLLDMESMPIYDITSDNNRFTWTMDWENHEIRFCFLKNAGDQDLKNVSLTFDLDKETVIEDLQETYDFTKENQLTVRFQGEESVWKLTAVTAVNPILDGEYADPDIDYFNGKYYIYPTTDGFSGWSGYQFHCFSSTDLVNWTDEGIILDVKNNATRGEDNANGFPGVPWAVGSAWAPSIEEKNGTYYFYFCAKRSDGVSCIGVAVADSPTGPFRAMDEPLLTPELCQKEAGINGGQTIDPSIYTEDGKSYILFGNGYGAIAELGTDMTSIVPGSMHQYTGTTDLRESIIVVKRNGLYHFTWSCDDTGSENYHVNYGTSDSLYGAITYRGTILAKHVDEEILGTGHHSILYREDTDTYYIAYHRFVTPVDRYSGDHGVHREVCIDRLTFDNETGLMNQVIPTHTGVAQ